MGYLDDLFNQDTYNGASPLSGLFDRLSGYVAAPAVAGNGFSPNPMNANAAMPATAAPQASSIAVGDYQMPRVGPAAAFTLPPGQLDPETGEHVQPAAPTPQPVATNPLMSIATALHSVAQGGSLYGAVTGQFDDPTSVKTREAQKLHTALMSAGVPRDQATLAVLNPEAAKSILPQYLGSDKFAFTTLPDGTVVRQNAKTGEVAPAYQGSAKPTFGVIGEDDGKKVYGWTDPTKRTVQPYQAPGGSGQSNTVTGPNGQPIAIPPGVDRKTFVNEISKTNADAATGKLTENQAKSSAYTARMESAEATLRQLENEGTSYKGRALDSAPLIGGTALTNSMQSNNHQKYAQARDNFIAALLRQESGAAIGKSEYEAADKQYFPQPGDSNAVIRQKAETRRIAIEQMKRAAGPGYRSPDVGAAPSASDPLGIL